MRSRLRIISLIGHNITKEEKILKGKVSVGTCTSEKLKEKRHLKRSDIFIARITSRTQAQFLFKKINLNSVYISYYNINMFTITIIVSHLTIYMTTK